MKALNAEKEKAEAAAKAKEAEAARKAELKAAADLGGGDSQWFEVRHAHFLPSHSFPHSFPRTNLIRPCIT